MKNLSLLFGSIVFVFSAYSQQSGYCGTQMPEEMTTWLKQYKQSGASAAKQADEGIYYIPLKIHLVGTNDGSGYHKISSILDGLCHLNEQYEQVGFHFYIYGDINYVNNTALYEHTSFNVGNIITQTKTADVANIYYVQDPAGNCGYFSGWRDFMAIAKSCAGPTNSTVAHELGHYFSLPHTFSGWEGRNVSDPAESDDERVNGSNCNNAGDYFCDTPADFISDRWGCPYNNTKVDYVGTPYAVDGSLYMSYANDACQDKFSPEQIEAMRLYLLTERSDLLNHSAPIIDSVGETISIYPPNGTLGVPANFAQLKWKKTTGATHYNLQVTRYFNGNFSNVDLVLQDTTYMLTNLEPGYNYRWRVRPFNEGNTCSSYTAYSSFVTRAATAIVPSFSVSNISCPGETDGSISIGASGGTGPYSYDWSTGTTGQSLVNLTEGNYFLTITDAAGADSLVISFDVVEPETLDAQIVQSNYVLNAEVNGGTPPFNYAWSNGVTVPQITMTGAGDYSITVSDSKGCSTTKSFFFTSITALDVAETRIYPNPLQTGEMLTVDLSSNETFKGSIEIFDNTGRSVFLFEKTFLSGKTKETLSLPAFAKGVYLLRISGDGVQPFNRKVAVF
ncbi:MAG: T9SS type A sorting domain-containing protein [Chitinophagales bacterium]|nr:T9SS type A sorting domain-containing protein [Chitinophagales bacterium]